MAAREQTGDSEFYRLILAYNDFTNLLRESLNVIGHCGMIYGKNAFRKHDVGGMSFRPCYFCRRPCSAAASGKSSFSADFRARLAAVPGFSARVWPALAREETDTRALLE